MKRILNGAFGLAFRDGKVLLSQRFQPQSPTAHLKWQIPGGGQEFGEHLETTLKREMKEELGVDVLSIQSSCPFFGFSVWDVESDRAVHVNLFVYIIDIGEQTPEINDEETNEWGWFSRDEAEKLDCLPNVKAFLAQAYKKLQ